MLTTLGDNIQNCLKIFSFLNFDSGSTMSVCSPRKDRRLFSKFHLFAFVVLTAQIQSSVGFTQSIKCDSLQPIPGVLGYQLRSDSDRCEGLYQSLVSGSVLEVLSFVRGPLSYNINSDSSLIVVVPDVTQLGSNQVRVEARSFPFGTYYRMDANVKSSGQLTWPIDAVISKAHLPSDSIGVLGWISRASEKMFVPVSVLSSASKRNQEREALTIIIRPLADISSLSWRSWSESNGLSQSSWHDLPGVFHAGDPIKVALDPKGSGVALVDVSGIATLTNDRVKLHLRVLIP